MQTDATPMKLPDMARKFFRENNARGMHGLLKRIKARGFTWNCSIKLLAEWCGTDIGTIDQMLAELE